MLIVDWDVHHGNGTQALVQDTADIRFVSMHQWPWYPGTGAGVRPRTARQRVERADAGRAAARRRTSPPSSRPWTRPRGFTPDVVLISAGFDSLAGDPLGGFTLEMDDVDRLTREMVSRAEQWCGGRLVSSLEGGYDPERLGEACVVHMRALAGGGEFELPPSFFGTSEEGSSSCSVDPRGSCRARGAIETVPGLIRDTGGALTLYGVTFSEAAARAAPVTGTELVAVRELAAIVGAGALRREGADAGAGVGAR